MNLGVSIFRLQIPGILCVFRLTFRILGIGLFYHNYNLNNFRSYVVSVLFRIERQPSFAGQPMQVE